MAPRSRLFHRPSLFLARLFLVLSVVYAGPVEAAARTIHVPAGTRVYAALNQLVSGRRRSGVTEGQPVHCRVWRDVIVNGKTVIRAGTPLLARVEKVKHASIAGVKGKLVLAALETQAVDGQTVQLEGGYHKEGKSRMALSITLAAVVLLPLIFISGKPAELPRDTVFDCYVAVPFEVSLEEQGAEANVPTIRLGDIASDFAAEVDLERLQGQKRPKVFHIVITGDIEESDTFVIDQVNEHAIEPIPTTIAERGEEDGEAMVVVTVPIKTLVKHFSKGINRFQLTRRRGDSESSQEIILNIQF